MVVPNGRKGTTARERQAGRALRRVYKPMYVAVMVVWCWCWCRYRALSLSTGAATTAAAGRRRRKLGNVRAYGRCQQGGPQRPQGPFVALL
ncbi:hypothetical protein K456DRAFT_47509, partial [Colletotrichum gloeosporioides 23]